MSTELDNRNSIKEKITPFTRDGTWTHYIQRNKLLVNYALTIRPQMSLQQRKIYIYIYRTKKIIQKSDIW